MRKMLVALLVASSLSTCAQAPATAHSWYDMDCCSENDCKPVSPEDVIEIEDGKWKYLPTGNTFEGKQIRPSKDGKFHVCIGVKEWDLGKSYCIYIVQGS